jgi:Bacterial regulatory proteins, gntR family
MTELWCADRADHPVYSAGVELHVSLDGRSDLTGQLYEQIRAAIAGGLLRPRDPLPSTRELARRLCRIGGPAQAYPGLGIDNPLRRHTDDQRAGEYPRGQCGFGPKLDVLGHADDRAAADATVAGRATLYRGGPARPPAKLLESHPLSVHYRQARSCSDFLDDTEPMIRTDDRGNCHLFGTQLSILRVGERWISSGAPGPSPCPGRLRRTSSPDRTACHGAAGR